jgi:replicative DNA helicase
MSNPELLSETDKYFLEPGDFTQQLDKFIFSAIYNLYINGAEKIHAADVDNYLQQNSLAKQLMEKENGLSLLQDCEIESEVSNFNYYYNKLKKFNLVRELQLSKDDIDEIYCEDILNERYAEINNRFERMHAVDVINILKSKIANIENRYVLNNIAEESRPSDSIRQRVKEWKEKPEIGCMLQGEIFNTITRGGRKGKLYIRSAGSGVGKTRSMVGDACHIAYPIRFDPRVGKWVSTGSCEKVLYVMTEQDTEEIDTMIMAYLTGYNEDIFTYGTFDENDPRIQTAMDIMERYADNMNYAKVSDPCSSIIKNLFRRRNLQDGIENFFYDYIFSSPAMLDEYRDLKIREDVALRMFTTTLKNLAVELNAFILTSTQLSNDDDPKGGFKDFRNVQGSKAIVNLADFACIMSRPSIEEINQVAEFKKSFGFTPNLVTDVYKNRRGRWNMVRIWSVHDLGTCRKHDLFITTANMKSVDNFIIVDFTAYEDGTLKELEKLYNTGEVTGSLLDEVEAYIEPNAENILGSLVNAFGDDGDRLERLKERSISDLL